MIPQSSLAAELHHCMSNCECVGVWVLNAVEFSQCLCWFGGALLRVNDLLLLLLFLCCLRLPHVKPKPTYRMTHEPSPTDLHSHPTIHHLPPNTHIQRCLSHRAHRISHTTFAALNLTQKARALAASKAEKKEGKLGRARKRMSEYKRAAAPATTTRTASGSELGPAAV